MVAPIRRRRSEDAGISSIGTAIQSAFGPAMGGVGGSGGGGLAGPTFKLNLMAGWLQEIGAFTPTFTRATSAYVQDFEGKETQILSGEMPVHGARRVENHASDSGDFSQASWNKTNVTVAGSISDPDGGTTAFSATATAGAVLLRQSIVKAAGFGSNTLTWVNSIWVKRRTGTGTISIVEPDGGVTAITTTGTWQRFAISGLGLNDVGSFIGIQITTSGDAVDVWHPQTEIVTGQS